MAEDRIDPEDLNHLLVGVIVGICREGSILPDTELLRAKREILKKEVPEIKARVTGRTFHSSYRRTPAPN